MAFHKRSVWHPLIMTRNCADAFSDFYCFLSN